MQSEQHLQVKLQRIEHSPPVREFGLKGADALAQHTDCARGVALLYHQHSSLHLQGSMHLKSCYTDLTKPAICFVEARTMVGCGLSRLHMSCL